LLERSQSSLNTFANLGVFFYEKLSPALLLYGTHVANQFCTLLVMSHRNFRQGAVSLGLNYSPYDKASYLKKVNNFSYKASHFKSGQNLVLVSKNLVLLKTGRRFVAVCWYSPAFLLLWRPALAKNLSLFSRQVPTSALSPLLHHNTVLFWSLDINSCALLLKVFNPIKHISQF